MSADRRFHFRSVSTYVGLGMGGLVLLALGLAYIGHSTLQSTREKVGSELTRNPLERIRGSGLLHAGSRR